MKKTIAIALTLMMTIGLLAGCSKTPAETTTNAPATQGTDAATNAPETTPEAKPANLSGTITMSGSTSMEKYVKALSESFMAVYPGVTITSEFPGSGAGIEAVTAGNVDIGNSSRDLKDTELANGLVQNVVAIDGIAVITEKSNTVTDLTLDDLAAIYKGEITNWSELGGEDQPIVVEGREAGSGTRGAFEEILKIADECKYANEFDNTGAVVAAVAATKGAIGYVSLDVLDDSVLALNLNGTAPTPENIKGGSYPLSRPFVMATKGEISEQNELVQALFDYVYSPEGKAVAQAVGLLTED